MNYEGGISTTAEEVSRFQCLFPNPNWLEGHPTSGIAKFLEALVQSFGGGPHELP